MQRIKAKISLMLMLTALLSIVSIDLTASPLSVEKRKEVNHSFKVDNNSRLQIENKYGSITITHWNKKEVAIRVEIICKSNNEREAQEAIDGITIEASKLGDLISAETNIRQTTMNNQSLNINYYLQMPASLKSELSQKYGNIHLPEKDNHEMEIEMKYSNLQAGDFVAPLSLEAKYSNIELGKLKEAELDIAYAGRASIEKAQKLEMESRYSSTKIGEVKYLNLNSKYDNISINQIDKLTMELAYSEATIGSLCEELEAEELSYSKMTINSLSPSFKQFNVDARYGNVVVKLPTKASFRVIAENMKYSKCNIKDFKTEQTSSDKSNHSYIYEVNGGKQPTIYFNGNNYSNLKIKSE